MAFQYTTLSRGIGALLLLLLLVLTQACTQTSPTSAVGSVDNTATPTVPRLTATATDTAEPTATHTPKPTHTRTPKPTRTRTPRPTHTLTPTVTSTSVLPPTPEQLPSPALPPPAQALTTTQPLTSTAAQRDTEPLSETVAAEIPAYVPILMYHYVRTVNEIEDPLGYGLSVSPEMFAQQMAWLHENNYTPMRMDRLMQCLAGETRCPARPIALTFDDGYEDAATIAMPIMQRYGFTGTFYIVTSFVGQPGYMSWEQLEMMRDNGMEIGAHSVHHPDLTSLSYDETLQEVTLSRATLQGNLDVPVESFCYPIGSYNLETMAMVQEVGYTNAVTTYPGASLESPYELPRRRILGGETLDAFVWYVTAFEA